MIVSTDVRESSIHNSREHIALVVHDWVQIHNGVTYVTGPLPVPCIAPTQPLLVPRR